MVVLPDCPLDGGMHIIDRLRAATPEGHTNSAGLALWNGTETAADLLDRANVALYAAKTSGRDRAVVSEPPTIFAPVVA